MSLGYVYKLECIETKRAYVGRTFSKDGIGRKQEHLDMLRRGKHPCKLMQHDYDAYGSDAFSYEIIEHGDIRSNDVKNCLEKIWMVKLETFDPNHGYNYCDPYFVNGIRDRKKKRAYVAERYSFPVELL